ncbi:MAG TPA: alpha/beta hydrolase [Nevskiales bacterium]|nr:alpha/beta hydrolase [Nevskiales bacterium]
MQTLLRALLFWSIRLLLKPVFSGWMPIGIQRFWTRVMTASSLPPRGTRIERLDLGGVAAECLSVPQSGARTLLYLHGGGYCVGSPRTHRGLAAHLARACGATAYVPDYRLAPEHPHPAALEDALACYRALLAQGVNPAQLVLGGDSAGGGLALATAVAIRDAQLPLPAALVLISPWTDLTLSGDSARTHTRRDPMLSSAIGALWSRLYLGKYPPDHPACSPLFASLTGLPPMLIQVGSEEILLSDSLRLAQRAQAAGVTVRLSRYAGMWHDFQAHAGLLHESDRAMTEVGDFVKNTIAAA